MSDIEPKKLKVAELREELKARGLDTKGNKAQLVKRLENALKKEAGEAALDTTNELEDSTLQDESMNQDDSVVEPPAEKEEPAAVEEEATPAVMEVEPEAEIKPEPEPEAEAKPEPEVSAVVEPEQEKTMQEPGEEPAQEQTKEEPVQEEAKQEPAKEEAKQEPVLEQVKQELTPEVDSKPEDETMNEEQKVEETELKPKTPVKEDEPKKSTETDQEQQPEQSAPEVEQTAKVEPIEVKDEEMKEEKADEGAPEDQEFQIMDSVGGDDEESKAPDAEDDKSGDKHDRKRRHSRSPGRDRHHERHHRSRRSRSRSPRRGHSKSRSRSRDRHTDRHHRSSYSDDRSRAPEVEENEDWLQATHVLLDKYNSDLNLRISEDGFKANPITVEGFAFMWSGARANYGATKGKVCFECKVLEALNVDHLPPEESSRHVVRVGYSTDTTSTQLGEEPFSYGYGGTGKASTDCKFKDFGSAFGADDVIGAFLDLESEPAIISYTKNGEDLGTCFEIEASTLDGKALFPHVLTKNCEFEVNFGQKEEPYFPPKEGFTFINEVPVEERTRGSCPPAKKEDCEMIMMCGLPGAGKTYWAGKHYSGNPEKKYNVLGTNNIIDKMKVMGLPRKRNYAGRWDVLIDKSTKCLNRMLEIAAKKKRNYILDQTNVYPTAQRRKMRPFEGFQRKAVVLVPTDEEFKSRCAQREKEEGKEVPDSAVLEMKANFQLPEKGPLFDEVEFMEENQEAAAKLIEQYNKEGRAALPPPDKRFRGGNRFSGDRYSGGGRDYQSGRYDRDNRGYNRDRGQGGRGGYNDRRGGGYMGYSSADRQRVEKHYDRRDNRSYDNRSVSRYGNQSQWKGHQGGNWDNQQGSWGNQGNWNNQQGSWGNQGNWGNQQGGWGNQNNWGNQWAGYQQGQQNQQNWGQPGYNYNWGQQGWGQQGYNQNQNWGSYGNYNYNQQK